MYNQFGYMPQMGFQTPQRQDIVKVNGENGARALAMAPNSSALVLDEREPLVWLCQTDGAGYKTVTAYKIEPIKAMEPMALSDLAERVSKLEEVLRNGKSDLGEDAGKKE